MTVFNFAIVMLCVDVIGGLIGMPDTFPLAYGQMETFVLIWLLGGKITFRDA